VVDWKSSSIQLISTLAGSSLLLFGLTTPGGPTDTTGIRGGDTPAQIAGREIVIGGDVILAIDDRDVRKIDDVLGYVAQATEVGDTVTVTVWRDGQIIEIPVTLGVRPPL
jgi:S1-C subfamily serine protease